MKLEDIKKSDYYYTLNKKFITRTETTSWKEFNDVVLELKALGLKMELPYTSSGGINYPELYRVDYCYGVRACELGAELVAITEDGCFKLQWRKIISKENEKVTFYGYIAYNAFKKRCKKHKIDLTTYYIKNGLEVKEKEIKKPLIEVLEGVPLLTKIPNVHHIDINSAYARGLVDAFPEFKPVIDEIFEERKIKTGLENENLKAMLNLSIGYMQSSKYFKAKLAHLSAPAVNYAHDKVNEMIPILESHGCEPLLLNTDGIWYQGPLLDINNTTLGEFRTDHKNCTLYIKTKGAYAYEENGIITPVCRGSKIKREYPNGIPNLETILDYDPEVYKINKEGLITWY